MATHFSEPRLAPIESPAVWSPPEVGSTRVYQQCESCGVLQETTVSGHFVAQGIIETLDNNYQ